MSSTLLLVLALIGPVELPGSDLEIKEACAKAATIVVAEAGEFDVIVGVGAVSFGSMAWKPSGSIKGAAKEDGLKTVAFSARGNETIPAKGEKYVVFVEHFREHRTAIKMLPATKENIEAVRKAIEADRNP